MPDQLHDKWLKAAVIGSYWGAFEIILGSFFHNMRFPLSGTLLSFFAVMLMVAFSRVWPERGLFWRAGLIAALMKSISPSAIILGPMTGILLEALLMEGAVMLLGRSLPGYLLGGALAVASALLHKVITLLVLYGLDLVRLLLALYHFALRSLRVPEGKVDPFTLVLLLSALYFLMGAVAALTGYGVGTRERLRPALPGTAELTGKVPESFSPAGADRYVISLLVLHLLLLIALMWSVARLPLGWSAGLVTIYAVFTLRRYDRALRHLRRPRFWIQVVGLTLLASLLWKGIETGNYFSYEGLVVGLRMNLRALLVMVAFSAISVEFRNPVIRILLFRKGFSGLYRATGLAFASFPWVMQSFPGPRQLFRRPLDVLADALATAHTLYERFAGMQKREPIILLVTAGVGGGKTTFLEQLVSRLNESGIPYTGFLARGMGEHGKRKGYLLRDLQSGSEQLLAEKKKGGRLRTGRFTFHPEVFRQEKEKVWRDLLSGRPRVVILDEVGPLELRGKGWAPLLERLVTLPEIIQVWAVREKIATQVPRAWDFSPRRTVSPDKTSPEELAAMIAEIIKKDLPQQRQASEKD